MKSLPALVSVTLLATAVLGQAPFAPPLSIPDGVGTAPPSGAQRNADVAAGNGGYLAVWEDTRNELTGTLSHGTATAHGDVLAMRYDATGAPIDTVPIVVAGTPYRQAAPRVAWNGSAWLVVFTSGRWTGGFVSTGIYAVRVAADGTVLDPIPIEIDDDDQPSELDADVTSDGQAWIVSWHDENPNNGNRLRRLVRIDGTGTMGPVSTLYNLASNQFPFRARLEFCAGTVLFVAERSGGVVARVIDPVTLTGGTQRTLASTGNDPVVACDGVGYYVAWRVDETFDKYRGSTVSTAGVVGTPGGDLIAAQETAAGGRSLSLGFDGDDYWVAFDQSGFTGGQWIEGHRIDGAGQPVAGNPVVLSNSPQPGGVVVAGGSAASSLLVVWEDARWGGNLSATTDLHGARVDEGVVTALGPLEASAANQIDSDLAGNAADGYLLVVLAVQSGIHRIVGLQLDANGVPTSGTPFVVHTGSEAIHTPRVAWNGSHWLVVWEEWLSIGGEGSGATIRMRRVAPGGTLPDPAPTSVMSGNWPDVAALGGQFLIAGSRLTSLNIRRVHARRVADNGTLSGASFLVADNFARYPRVESTGNHWVLGWQHKNAHNSASGPERFRFVESDGQLSPGFFTGANSAERGDLSVGNGAIAVAAHAGGDLHVRRFDAATGAELTGSFVTVSNAPLDQFAPKIGNDGTRFLVSWIDNRIHASNSEGLGDVYAARFETTGGLLAADMPIATSPGTPEATGAVAGAGGITLVTTHEYQASPTAAGWVTRLRVLDEGVVCQPDLGQAGPGAARATLCGTGLGEGESSDYVVTDAEPGAAGAFLISLPNAANVTLFPASGAPGVLVSGAALAASFPVAADGSGGLSFPVPGLAAVTDLVFQSVFADSSVAPHNLAFTNALLAEFGR